MPDSSGCRTSTATKVKRPGPLCRWADSRLAAGAGAEIVDSCHLVSFLQQAVDKGGTDESGSAGDEGAHYQLSPVRR